MKSVYEIGGMPIRWVSGERWHSKQRSETLVDGNYMLEIPYSNERELVGELKRFGANVEVLGFTST
jgi:hypothetical protein